MAISTNLGFVLKRREKVQLLSNEKKLGNSELHSLPSKQVRQANSWPNHKPQIKGTWATSDRYSQQKQKQHL